MRGSTTVPSLLVVAFPPFGVKENVSKTRTGPCLRSARTAADGVQTSATDPDVPKPCASEQMACAALPPRPTRTPVTRAVPAPVAVIRTRMPPFPAVESTFVDAVAVDAAGVPDGVAPVVVAPVAAAGVDAADGV